MSTFACRSSTAGRCVGSDECLTNSILTSTDWVTCWISSLPSLFLPLTPPALLPPPQALPIAGVTNSECFLPFGGIKSLSPNSVDTWNAEVVLSHCYPKEKSVTTPKRPVACDNYYQTWRSGAEFTPTRKQAAFEKEETLRLMTATPKGGGPRSMSYTITVFLTVCYCLALTWKIYGAEGSVYFKWIKNEL